jgi:fluoroquinolone resistance protein
MKIQDRWIGKEETFLKNQAICESPFGKNGEREDFGGIVFPQGFKIVGKKFVSVELSNSSFSNTWIEKCYFDNSLWQGGTFANASDHGNTYRNCTFQKVDFRGAVLGFLGSGFTDCRFEKCNFIKCGFIRAEFTNCTFIDCKLKGTDFNASSFEACTFIGRLDDVWFRGDYMIPTDQTRLGIPKKNQMATVSFKEAELHRLAFSQGCSLDSIVIPQYGSYTFVKKDWRSLLLGLEHQAALFPSSIGKEVGIFTRVYLVGSDKQDQYLLNNEDIVKDFGKDAAGIIIGALNG